MRPKVYLCGPISGLTVDECTAERNRIAEELAAVGINAYSPMRGKEHLVPKEQIIGSGGYTTPIATENAIFRRDHNDVKTADALLADLRGAKKVSIGSMVEFGWADAYRIPIVTVMDDGNAHDHLFVRQASTYVTADMEHALNLLQLLLLPSAVPPLHVVTP